MTDKKQLNTKNIQEALKASKAKKSNPEESTPAEGTDEQTSASPEATKRPRLTEEQRLLREAQRIKERAEKRAIREAERAQKRAAREAERAAKVPHMAKVEKQAKNLPTLVEPAQEIVTDILDRLDESAITAIVAHLNHELRVKATANALKVDLKEGQLVRIMSADTANNRWVGQLAHVLQVQRIRCYVQPLGTEKRVYLFSSNVKPLSDDEIAALPSDEPAPMSETA